MIDATFRPIDHWPAVLRDERSRLRSQFSAPWSSTLELLDQKLRALGAEAVVVKLALTDQDIRRDGWPKSKASPEHPGVVIEFDSPEHGWLRYYDDQYTTWRDNLRALALSLEALRALGRWGALRGEQYVGSRPAIEAGPAAIPGESSNNGGSLRDGFKPPGAASRPAPLTTSTALRLLEEHSGTKIDSADPPTLERVYRRAARKLHPDVQGGDAYLFARLQEARDLLIPDTRRTRR